MSTNKSVVVLTPSYRRKTVPVTPNTTILQILEEVCQKEQLQPEEYDLKHHREILDTTMTLQFSGLPNNALLEMVPVQRVRKESPVTLVLQLESGDRLTGTFLPSDTLWTVVTNLCPEEEVGSGKEANPVVIYMRQEIAGAEALQRVTLRHLGLTGGRAMLRFVHRTPDELHIQANVSAPLKRVQATPKETTQEKQVKPLDITCGAEMACSDMTVEEPIAQPEQLPSAVTKDSELLIPVQDVSVEQDPVVTENKMDTDTLEADMDSERIESHRTVSDVVTESGANGESSACESSYAAPDGGNIKPIVLGERSAIVFLLDSAPELQKEELPDKFFDVTLEDARFIYSDLINKRAELEEAILSTSAMRELEKSKQILNNLNQYRKVVLRIQFPDRSVLQGTFSPVETVLNVMEFVRQYLENPGMSFHLFITPPKQILAPELTLVEAGCVPSALLHFGCDTCDFEFFIRQDILSRSSSFAAAMAAASQCRRKVPNSHPLVSSTPCEKRPPSPQPSTSRQSDDAVVTEDNQTRVAYNRDTTKLPKWFKIGK